MMKTKKQQATKITIRKLERTKGAEREITRKRKKWREENEKYVRK